MNLNRLDGKVALISGAASGMGQATAELFSVEGAKVFMADVQRDRGLRVAEQISSVGGKAIFHECDVADENEVKEAIEKAVAHFGSLQIIINCAGKVDVGLLHNYTEEQWDKLMNVNVKGIFWTLKHGIDHLKNNKRSYMVNIGSVGSFVGQAETPAYTASKHAVLGLTRNIALDYASYGLRCNCICPGITDTPMLRYHLSTTGDPEGALSKRLRRVPTGVAIRPTDIAKSALFLSCEDSSGVTGTSLVVDGGYTTPAEWETQIPTRFMEEP